MFKRTKINYKLLLKYNKILILTLYCRIVLTLLEFLYETCLLLRYVNMCTLFVFAKLYEINDNLLLFLRFRLFRYLFKLAIGITNATSNTIECLIYYGTICWT